MKYRIGWLTGLCFILAMSLIAGCGGSPTCPDLEGTITGQGEAAGMSQGKVKVTDGGDSITWTATDTGYKAIDGVKVKGKIDKPAKGMMSRNITDAKADLKGDYDKCQLVVTGALTGPGDQKPATCQGSGNWEVVCNGASKATGTWQVSPAAQQAPAGQTVPKATTPEHPTTPQKEHPTTPQK
jgi:hypothetical protein